MSLRHFIHMGGYGPFIWSCYGLTLATLIWNLWSARRELRRQIAVSKRRLQASEGQSS
jgi:heme exporter protein CcmD